MNDSAAPLDLVAAEEAAAELFGRLVTPEARLDPYPIYEEMRAMGPVVDTGFGLWLVTDHNVVRTVLHDPRFSSDESKSAFNQANETADVGDRPMHPMDDMDLMLFLDQPDHTRLRKFVSRSFTPRRIAEIAPRVHAVVTALLDAVEDQETIDVIGDLGFPLATQIICELLGVPVEDRTRFGHWSADLSLAIDPSSIRSPEQDNLIGAATEAFLEYFTDLIEQRRNDPGDDLLSALIAVEETDDRLTVDELCAMGVLLLVAGHETTVNLVGNSIAALAADPDATDRLLADPDAWPGAVDEFLRYEAPVQFSQRIALEDLEIAGLTVPAGTSLVLLLAAANRDPQVFDDPHRLHFDRPDVDHVSFGGGIHHCLGAALARTEGAVAIEQFLARRGRPVLVDEGVRRPTFTLRGFQRLDVTTATD